MNIPFNKPTIEGRELEYVRQAVEQSWASGDGPFTEKCSRLLKREIGSNSILLTPSCTDALEMMAILLEIEPGDQVIVPSFTFVSTVNAFVLRGAEPVFADIRPDTLNIDESCLSSLMSDQTKAVVAVHYAGVGCEMDDICRVADHNGVAVLEDNAHGLFGKYKNKLLGSIGSMGALSFHETKDIICGEGGALLVNDPALTERAEIIRTKGTDRNLFFRGEVDKYTWVDIGSSYVMSDLLAAFLYAQLEVRENIRAKRSAIWSKYKKELSEWAVQNGVRLPFVPETCDQAYHMFYLIMSDETNRNGFISYLRENEIAAVFHYQPLHASPMGSKLATKKTQCPVSDDISKRIVRLPFYTNMTETEQDYVIETVLSWNDC